MRAVEIHRLFQGQPGDLLFRADGRAAIGAVRVKRGHEVLPEGTGRIAVHHLPAFLDDHIAFGDDAPLGRSKVHHPVGFHFHHQAEPVSGDANDVPGAVDRGEGIEAAAVLLDGPLELALVEAVRRLEHQVLQEMRDAGLSRAGPRRTRPGTRASA